MKINPGFITNKLQESKEFYSKYLNFEVKFENDFYILMENKNSTGNFEISFLQPEHPSQEKIFQQKYNSGSYLTIEVPNVEKEYDRLKKLECPIAFDLKEEVWGDKHFAIIDPNGLGLDILTYSGSI